MHSLNFIRERYFDTFKIFSMIGSVKYLINFHLELLTYLISIPIVEIPGNQKEIFIAFLYKLSLFSSSRIVICKNVYLRIAD